MTDKKQHAMLNSLTGAFIGGLAGGVTMLLLAPQSGQDTRTKIQKKSIELLDDVLSRVENAASQMRSDHKKRRIRSYKKPHYLTEQRQTRIVPHSDFITDVVQTETQATESVSLASPNDEERPMDDIDNLVAQQPIGDGVVNDSMGG